jgi:hypothetical protein
MFCFVYYTETQFIFIQKHTNTKTNGGVTTHTHTHTHTNVGLHLQKAAFYGAFGSNHPELAESYFSAVVDGVPAARRGAAALAAAHNITTCSVNATHFNAHITPWGYGDYDEGGSSID